MHVDTNEDNFISIPHWQINWLRAMKEIIMTDLYSFSTQYVIFSKTTFIEFYMHNVTLLLRKAYDIRIACSILKETKCTLYTNWPWNNAYNRVVSSI